MSGQQPELITGPGTMTDAEMTSLLEELAADETPRLVALYDVAPDNTAACVFAWGLVFDSRVILVHPGPEKTTYGSLGSLDRALRLFGRSGRRLRIVRPRVAPDRDFEAAWPGDEDEYADLPVPIG